MSKCQDFKQACFCLMTYDKNLLSLRYKSTTKFILFYFGQIFFNFFEQYFYLFLFIKYNSECSVVVI
jgi:hypothetical protein